jgi:hypothetical protein
MRVLLKPGKQLARSLDIITMTTIEHSPFRQIQRCREHCEILFEYDYDYEYKYEIVKRKTKLNTSAFDFMTPHSVRIKIAPINPGGA